MIRIDLDDLPPKLAQLLTGAEAGEEIVLVQGGLVAARLVAQPPPETPEEPPPLTDDQRAAEIFEQFRSQMEDEF
jgi:antitoxin (DNA-binding transcriptional repressor) of toxin-antitoxin stability system